MDNTDSVNVLVPKMYILVPKRLPKMSAFWESIVPVKAFTRFYTDSLFNVVF